MTEALRNYNSAYAAPGGMHCMYCGTGHSTGAECRLPCSHHGGCDLRGIPWQVDGVATGALCLVHKPAGGEPLPVPPPRDIA